MKPIYIAGWEKWKELCEHYSEDPYRADFSIDEGGGNSTDFEFIGNMPEREE